MQNNFNLKCLTFQEKIIEIFNKEEDIPFLLKYYLFKDIWKSIEEAKIRNDYNTKLLKDKPEDKEKIIETSIDLPKEFFQQQNEE